MWQKISFLSVFIFFSFSFPLLARNSLFVGVGLYPYSIAQFDVNYKSPPGASGTANSTDGSYSYKGMFSGGAGLAAGYNFNQLRFALALDYHVNRLEQISNTLNILALYGDFMYIHNRGFLKNFFVGVSAGVTQFPNSTILPDYKSEILSSLTYGGKLGYSHNFKQKKTPIVLSGPRSNLGSAAYSYNVKGKFELEGGARFLLFSSSGENERVNLDSNAIGVYLRGIYRF